MDFSHIDIENDKVKKIMKSAYEVFALNDLKKASTNEIVKRAGVSRGILYHYFKDKEELFNFLIYYSVEKGILELDQRIQWDDDDLIRRICDISKYRLEFIKEYPYGLEFSEKYGAQMSGFVDKKVLAEWREKFYHQGIDYSKFKDESMIDHAIHMMRWTYKGLSFEFLRTEEKDMDSSSIDQLIQECEDYYQVFVSLFY